MDITTKRGETFLFTPFEKQHAERLSAFFESLSDDTRSKFGPHPLTRDYVFEHLVQTTKNRNVERFVLSSQTKIIGYFIVDYREFAEEKQRYHDYGIVLNFTTNPVFAPCIADAYQSQGIASQALKALLVHLHQQNIESLVLMGGTQAPNKQARQFYKKMGFEELGEFYTQHNQLNNVDMRLLLSP